MSPLPYADAACFTGHRHLARAQVEPLQERLREKIVQLHREQGVCHFLSGGAVGFDLLGAVTVINLRYYYPDLRLHMILPCEHHDASWSTQDRNLLSRILPRADEVLFTAKEYDRACMFVRNRYLVDHSRYCIAFLNRMRGGTAYTVGYAQKQGLEICNLAQGLL